MPTEQSAAVKKAPVTPAEALNHLAELVTSYAQAQAFAAAVKLGVMEEIGKGSATPEEIAAVIHFLLSEESSFMTGHTLAASGGRVTLP